MHKTYIKALTIAGSDSGGGAGIQADLKTFSALGCYGASAIAALTAQNTLGVQGILAVPPEFIAKQIRSVLDDIGADAIKIGMLHSAEVIEAVVSELKSYRDPLVLDPVMVAKDGSLLLEKSAIDVITKKLFPIATIITPNIFEAEALLNRKIHTREEMEKAALDLAEWGSESVLIKGGHLAGDEGADCLYLVKEKKYHWFVSPAISTVNTHGTGCTLSAAIAAFLAHQCSLVEAVSKAKTYITAAIEKGGEYCLGQGHGPVHHFYNFHDRDL